MRKIEPYELWIGHAGDLQNVPGVLAQGIAVVMELAGSEASAKLPRDIVHIRIPLSDGGENRQALLKLTIDAVACMLSDHIPTLVACSAGLSRSVAIASVAVAIHEKRPFKATLLDVCQSHPADVAPLLVNQIEDVLNCSRY
jgi:hypothetical protein